MSAALSIHKPGDDKPAKPSAAALLGAAIKKGAKSSSHLVCDMEAAKPLGTKWLELATRLDETERELGLVREQLLDLVRPWHAEQCTRRRSHESTVEFSCPGGQLRV